MLYGSGMIAGAAMIGVVGAALAFFEVELPTPDSPPAQIGAVIAFGIIAATLWQVAWKGFPGSKKD